MNHVSLLRGKLPVKFRTSECVITDKKGDTEFSKLVHLEKSKREHIENHGGCVAMLRDVLASSPSRQTREFFKC